MNPQLRAELMDKRAALETLCRKHSVASLEIFGSGATKEWEPGESDLDFIVTFRQDASGRVATRYLGLAEDLEALFGRPVDLITSGSIRNPYFRERVNASRSRIYAE